jgi:hypothetical protein
MISESKIIYKRMRDCYTPGPLTNHSARGDQHLEYQIDLPITVLFTTTVIPFGERGYRKSTRVESLFRNQIAGSVVDQATTLVVKVLLNLMENSEGLAEGVEINRL